MTNLCVKVVPGSSRDQVVGWLGDSLKVKVTAAAEKGKANAAVVACVAKLLGIRTDEIEITAGHSSPMKVVAIESLNEEAIRAKLASILTAQPTKGRQR